MSAPSPNPTAAATPRVGIACSPGTAERYLRPDDLAALRVFAEVTVTPFTVDAPPWAPTPVDPAAEDELIAACIDLDALVVCHGAPRVTDRVFTASPRLKLVGELEGDRFAGRIDVTAAAGHGVTVVDTTHSSSWPVAEWALALALLGLRRFGRIHDVIAGRDVGHRGGAPYSRELTGKRVGLIGFGHIAWRLRELLAPFDTPIVAHDPHVPRELADALGVDLAPLTTVLGSDVVICLAPATPATTGMIGAAELDLLRPDAVFVNVSRGVVVDSAALLARARRGDAWFALDAHDPEPLAVDSPLRTLPNVFCTPHIGGVTREAGPRFFTLMVDELRRFFAGTEPRAQLTDRVVAGRHADRQEQRS